MTRRRWRRGLAGRLGMRLSDDDGRSQDSVVFENQESGWQESEENGTEDTYTHQDSTWRLVG
jgi:hypothetical protein